MMFTIQAKWEEAMPRIHAVCVQLLKKQTTCSVESLQAFTLRAKRRE